ncbi:MAG TPA: formyltetrahydrofolate deformylase [Gaiellaceae bacterium]|nr:formyltetrahydrofolate deformylase [Gaiellaceae bacterium]
MPRIRLLIACADRPGIVASVSGFLFERGANIVDSAQHTTDAEGGTFFMRTEFDLAAERADPPELERAFDDEVARRFGMERRFDYGRPKRAAVLVSRYEHCLLDLLWRGRRGELGAEIVQVISNHPDLEPDVRTFGIPFAHVPVESDRKPEAEARMLELLEPAAVDFVVLARYMQILSGEFLARLGVPVINIHHSFLPAFVGADPYRRAHERGVKIIGATAHYVTEELDAGPIIEQDVERVSHRHDLDELERIGRDVERVVLARAVRWHVEDRVIVHANKTFVFE